METSAEMVTPLSSTVARSVSLTRSLLSSDAEGSGRVDAIRSVTRDEEKEGLLGTGATVNADRAAVVNLSDRARSVLDDGTGGRHDDQEGADPDQNPDKPGIQLEKPDPEAAAKQSAQEAEALAEPDLAGLTDMEREIVRDLKAQDRRVRSIAAEQKSMAGAGAGPGTFQVQIGPNGEPYYIQSRIPVETAATANGFDTDPLHPAVGASKSDAGVAEAVANPQSDRADPLRETVTADDRDHVGDYAGSLFRPSGLEGLLRPTGTSVEKRDAQKAEEYANPFSSLADPLRETIASFLSEYDGTARWQFDIPHPTSYSRRAANAYTAAGA